MNIRVSSRSSQEIHIAFQGTRSPYGLRLATAVLYRWKDSGEPYKLQRINERQNSARLRSLAPGKDYEINAAAYNRTSGFPGVFITVTNNTFGKSVCGMFFQGPRCGMGDSCFYAHFKMADTYCEDVRTIRARVIL